jgi:DNA repair photolyase
VPSGEARIEAMRRCAARGYPVRAVIMPVIPVPGWNRLYAAFLERLLSAVPLDRLTFGGICIYKGARSLMESKLGKDNPISSRIAADLAPDGRARYAKETRLQIYEHLITTGRRINPSLPLALCLEEVELWKRLNLHPDLGRCNCVL